LNTDPSSPENPAIRNSFAPTRWTLILRARGETPESKTALSELCEAYYQPVLLFLRREGRDEDAARELTQEFFARVLAGGGFEAADPQRGRFRSYLLGALKHFLADQRKHDAREKRGGGVASESLDATTKGDEASSLQVADTSTPPPEAFFDRQWALTVMARGLDVLQQEFRREDKGDQFETLKPWLVGEAAAMSQAEAARRLGLTEGAVKVAVHRLRKRFRESVRVEIAQTLRDPALVDEELRHLVEALT
jgi:RNA polymerase sigma-70 factor (ECF subfamily)